MQMMKQLKVLTNTLAVIKTNILAFPGNIKKLHLITNKRCQWRSAMQCVIDPTDFIAG